MAEKLSFSKFALKWIAVAALSIATGEISLWAWGFAPAYHVIIKGLPEDRGHLVITLDEERLFRLKPWAAGHINKWGYHDVEFTPRTPERRRVIVIGDSFPMGLAVRPEHTFPKLLPSFSTKSLEVFNLGIQGYGPDQELDVIEHELNDLEPECVLWSVFPGNDFEDIIRNELFTLTPDRQLKRVSPSWVGQQLPTLRIGYAINLLRYGSFLSPSIEKQFDAAFFQDKVRVLYDPKDPRRVDALLIAEQIYRQGKKLLESKRIPLVAAIVPSIEVIQDDARLREENVPKDLYFSNEQLAGEMLTKVGIPYIDLTAPFLAHRGAPLFETADRHLSEVGHQEAARAISPIVDRCLAEGNTSKGQQP